MDEFRTRKSPRLSWFDYRNPNVYFITVCTSHKKCIFGEAGCPNQFGLLAAEGIKHISDHYPGVMVEKYVVMPNHVHMLLQLNEENRHSISVVVGSYKSFVSQKIHQIDPAIPVWQRSFHDHIVRSTISWEKIWNYIEENPARWNEDMFFQE